MRAWAVFKREYLQAVRRKSFVIMTVVAPFLMLAMMLVPAVLTTRGLGVKHVLVIDGTGRIARAFEAELPFVPEDGSDERADGAPTSLATSMRVEAITAVDPDLALTASLARMAPDHDAADRLDGILVLPGDLVDSPRARAAYYARASTDFPVQRRLERAVNRAVVRADRPLVAAGPLWGCRGRRCDSGRASGPPAAPRVGASSCDERAL